MIHFRALTIGILLTLGSVAAHAQGANVAFGAIKADPTLPVEVTSDTLDVNQADGSAEFKGNVLVSQGEMRLSAQRVLVIYRQERSGIERLEATGDVVLVSGPDAAQAQRADYTIDSGIIVMTGDVLLTQGQNALTSSKMTVNLISGTAQMVGRVKTILNPENK
ncbi:LptA/OstA family protein [Ruegeria marina]|uniref:Lipopolysaccharide export system protein LptA n=1 Tax=Ruegeria marina TaxID=639004 RepID=A0A1G6WSF1_9RHOB|nr:lipopolysaccharide export system protein LptA [Ruegeria marina]